MQDRYLLQTEAMKDVKIKVLPVCYARGNLNELFPAIKTATV